MEELKLYDLLDRGLPEKWRDQIEKEKNSGWLFENEQNLLQESKAVLDEKGKENLSAYASAIKDRMDDILYDINVKILNLGVMIGMELEKSFAGIDD